MGLHVAGLGNGLRLKEAQHVLHRELFGQLDVGPHRNDLALFVHIAQCKVIFGVVICGKGVHAIQVVQTGSHPGRCALAVVGGGQIDDIGSGISHKGPGLLGHFHQICGGDHVFGVVQVDLADGGNIGLHKGNTGGQLQGDVGVARKVLHKPCLVLVRNKHTGAAGCTGGVVDRGQQGHALPGSGGFTEQDRGDLSFFDAVVHIGVLCQNSLHAVKGLRGRDHDALFVGASLLIGGVVVGTVTVRADPQGVVVPACRVAVAVVGKGVTEAIAAVVELPGLVLASSTDVVQLVVIVGAQVLNAPEHGGAILGQVTANVKCRTGRSRTDHAERCHGNDDCCSNFFEYHNRIPSLFVSTHLVDVTHYTPITNKMQVYLKNKSLYSYFNELYSCVFLRRSRFGSSSRGSSTFSGSK